MYGTRASAPTALPGVDGASPPVVLTRCTNVVPSNTPGPVDETAPSSSHGIASHTCFTVVWARLTADDARVVLALNVEQGNVFGTLLHYHALATDGGDAGALPGPAVAEPFSVDLRP